jgi:hypothetical protein
MKLKYLFLFVMAATNIFAQTNKFSYPIEIPSGSSSAPAIVFYGDPNTGIYRITADSMALVCGGVHTLRIGSGGLYWIGTYPNDDLLNRNDYWNSLVVGINATFSNYNIDTVGYSFDGTNDYAWIADHDSLDFGTGEFTFMWYGLLDTVNFTAANEKPLIRKTAGTTGYYFYLSNRKIRWNWYSEEINLDLSVMGIDSGYYHLVFTRDANGNLSWYNNGILKSTKSGTGVAGNFTSSGAFIAGYGNLAGRYTNARFHSMRLFAKCLTADEVNNFYNAGKPDFYEQSDSDMRALKCRAQWLGRNAIAATWAESLNSLNLSTSGSPTMLTGEIMPLNTVIIGNETTDYVSSYGNFISSTLLARDSLQIASNGKYIRKVFQSTGGDSLGFVYYNTVRVRADTVWMTQ